MFKIICEKCGKEVQLTEIKTASRNIISYSNKSIYIATYARGSGQLIECECGNVVSGEDY